MDKRIDISDRLCADEVVCFLADRYHTTPKKVVQCFLAQCGIDIDGESAHADFRLEDNEMEILRGLARIAPIPGITTPDHLDDFLGAATVRLTPYEMEEFDKEYARINLMGHRADPFTESRIDK